MDPPRVITNIEKKREMNRNRAPMADAMLTVRRYKEKVDRDILGADDIWERLDGPYLRDGDDPLRGCSSRAFDRARKGKEFIGLSKNFGTSKAAQIIRPDARRRNGPLIRRTDAPADFERAVYNSLRRRDSQFCPGMDDWMSSDMTQ